MTLTITIRDKVMGESAGEEFSLEIQTEEITVRKLIKSRVYKEVKDFNEQQKELGEGIFHGLVQPGDAEKTLNGYKVKAGKQIDWEEQFARALEAFESNEIVVLINEKQVESLDEKIELHPELVVSFLALTQLVGG